MKKIVLLSLVVIVLVSCQKTWYVIPDSDISDQDRSEAFMYCLPRTSLEIEIQVNEHHFVPGPYADFAESYLNISGVEQQERFFWTFKDVKLNAYTEADPDAVYWLFPESVPPVLTYCGQSRLLGVNAGSCQEDKLGTTYFYSEKVNFPEDLAYTDLNVKRNTYEVIDTTWRVIEKDSLIQRIPIYKSVEREKNWHHKAQDAADFVIKIRKRKFKLEAAIDEQQADGDGVGIMIQKLEELEQSYLDLFVGKTITETKVYRFKLTPDAMQGDKPYLVSNLDVEDGSPQADSNETIPFMLEIVTPENIQFVNSVPEDHEDAGLYVRNAGMAQCKLFLDDVIVYEASVMIPQLFPVTCINAKNLNQNSKIFLNPESGNLERIE